MRTIYVNSLLTPTLHCGWKDPQLIKQKNVHQRKLNMNLVAAEKKTWSSTQQGLACLLNSSNRRVSTPINAKASVPYSSRESKSFRHSLLKDYLEEMGIKADSDACCVPTKLRPMSLVYYEEKRDLWCTRFTIWLLRSAGFTKMHCVWFIVAFNPRQVKRFCL